MIDRRRILLTFAAALVFAAWAVPSWSAIQAGGGLLDDDLGATTSEMQAAAQALGADAIEAYPAFLVLEGVATALFAAGIAGTLWITSRVWHGLPARFAAAPLLAATCNGVENVAIAALLQGNAGAGALVVLAMHLQLALWIASGSAVAFGALRLATWRLAQRA